MVVNACTNRLRLWCCFSVAVFSVLISALSIGFVQVCFYGIDLVNVCELLQVVESREAAISLGESLLAHSIILEMYGTQEFKYKKKIYRFACDHNLLYFDGAAGGHLGDKQAFNVNPAVFEPCKRFRNEPNFVVAKIQEILRNGVESVRAHGCVLLQPWLLVDNAGRLLPRWVLLM